jgi:hypothetical protein
MKKIISINLLVLLCLVLILYQNCLESEKPEDASDINVTCTPPDSCLKFKLISWSQLSCPAGQNKVQIQTRSDENGSPSRENWWDGCNDLSSGLACCNQGPVSGGFSTIDGRTINISFNNSASNSVNYSNKVEGEAEIVCPCDQGRLLYNTLDPSEDSLDLKCDKVCEGIN